MGSCPARSYCNTISYSLTWEGALKIQSGTRGVKFLTMAPVVWFPTRIKFSTQNGVTFDPLPGYFPVLIRIGWSENRLAKST